MLSCRERHPWRGGGPRGTLSRMGLSACCPGGARVSRRWCTDPCGPGLRGVESPSLERRRAGDAHHHRVHPAPAWQWQPQRGSDRGPRAS